MFTVDADKTSSESFFPIIDEKICENVFSSLYIHEYVFLLSFRLWFLSLLIH